MLQGEAVARTGAPLTPARMRDLLVSTGLPQVPTPGDENVGPQDIGPRPQVDDALAALGSPPQPPPSVPDAILAPPSGATAAPAASAPTPAPFAIGGLDHPRREGPARRRGPLHPLRPARRACWWSICAGWRPRRVVRVGGRRVAVRAGRIVLQGVRPGRTVLRVSAPARRAGATYSPVAFRITIPVRAPVRVGASLTRTPRGITSPRCRAAP